MSSIKKTADVTRTRKGVRVNKPGNFFIRDPKIDGNKKVFWFTDGDPDKVWPRPTLIAMANAARKWYGETNIGTGDEDAVHDPALSFDCEWLSTYHKNLLNQGLASNQIQNFSYTNEEIVQLQAQVEAGTIPWWKAPNYDNLGHKANARFVNIGGFVVAAGPRFPSGMPSTPLMAIVGSRNNGPKTSTVGRLLVKSNGTNFPIVNSSSLEGFPVLTLLDPTTGEPNFEKTAEWHMGEDPEFMSQLIGVLSKYCSYYCRPAGTYISEGWEYFTKLPNTEPKWNELPSPAKAIEEVNFNMQKMEVCKDVAVAAAEWVPICFSDHQPKYDSTGKFLGYDESKLKYTYRWGLRMTFKKRGGKNGTGKFKQWGSDKNICAWVSYRPDIDAERPWRLIKSTKCQRKNRWSKYDKGIAGNTYYNQALPDTEHAICQWACNSMAQMASDYPVTRVPIFNGGTDGVNGVNIFKQKLQAAIKANIFAV